MSQQNAARHPDLGDPELGVMSSPRRMAEDAPTETKLDELQAMQLRLSQSLLNEAQMAVQLRQRELELALLTVRLRYEENGKYTVTKLDLARGVVERVLVRQAS